MGLRLLETGLVIGTWGNVSVRAGGKVVITPSGADYTLLQEEDMPVVDLETGAYEGAKPSSEKGLHLEVYRQRKEINAVIHVHSPHAATLAAAQAVFADQFADLQTVTAADGTEFKLTAAIKRARFLALLPYVIG